MKKYLKPALEIAEVRNITMIAVSGGSNNSDTDFDTTDDNTGITPGYSPFKRRNW